MKPGYLKRCIGGLAAVAALGLTASPANAQIWIGQIVGEMAAQNLRAQRETACRAGIAPSAKELAEAASPAGRAMAGYAVAAAAGRPIAGYFHAGSRTRWTSGTVSVGAAGLDAQRDPFLTGGLRLDPTPIAFVRSSDSRSALGQWAARSAAGKQGGTYTGYFTRRAGVWLLETLTLTPADRYVDPVAQYCHEAGDVIGFRLADTRAMREYAERRVAKLERKLAGSTDPARSVKLQRELTERRAEFENARAAEQDAKADAKQAADTKAAALAALNPPG